MVQLGERDHKVRFDPHLGRGVVKDTLSQLLCTGLTQKAVPNDLKIVDRNVKPKANKNKQTLKRTTNIKIKVSAHTFTYLGLGYSTKIIV